MCCGLMTLKWPYNLISSTLTSLRPVMPNCNKMPVKGN